jgi:hypothetical protein
LEQGFHIRNEATAAALEKTQKIMKKYYDVKRHMCLYLKSAIRCGQKEKT